MNRVAKCCTFYKRKNTSFLKDDVKCSQSNNNYHNVQSIPQWENGKIVDATAANRGKRCSHAAGLFNSVEV